jgi:hypothetical protein
MKTRMMTRMTAIAVLTFPVFLGVRTTSKAG